MKRLILCLLLVFSAQASMALSPYVQGTKLSPTDLSTQLTAIEKKLQDAGFTIVGRHFPKGMPLQASIIATDPGILDAIRTLGGSAVVASGIRVGVQRDGTVSYINPEYWYRAFFRKKYADAQSAVKSAQTRLNQALGNVGLFGGDVAQEELADYRYMFGMERFDSDNSELVTHTSFEEALTTVQTNLANAKADTSQVYEVIMRDRKMAVFGVAMNSVDSGEGWWVNKIDGASHVAALPYEIFIVDNKVYALYARYRIALSWPALGMGQFMRIINAPVAIRDTMSQVATKL